MTLAELRQAIAILQMSTLELAEHIHQGTGRKSVFGRKGTGGKPRTQGGKPGPQQNRAMKRIL